MSEADKTARELYLGWVKLNGAGQYEQAVQVADQMLALEGISSTARQWAEASKQTSALNGQRLRTAEARFQQALAEDPKSAQAWVERGEELLDLGLEEAAVQSFQQALELDPQSAAAWCGLGVIKAEVASGCGSEDREEKAGLALTCFDRALDLDPHSETAWFYKGLALSDLGRSEEALACLNHILEHLNPEHPWAWYAKGLELAAIPRTASESMTCFVKGLQLDPDQEPAWSCHEVRLRAAD